MTATVPRTHARALASRPSPPGPLLPALAALALATTLELALRFVPAWDPYGWLVWGHQTIHGGLDPTGAPSWKPLPWLLTTPLALFGSAAPTLWLIVACTGGLVALWLVYRLAFRLGGVLAGVVAVLAVLVCRNWVIFMLTGNSEPLAAALTLGAVDRHLAGHRRLAVGLGALAALTRPECGLLLAPYLLWLWRTEPNDRRMVAAVALAVPILWFLPPYASTGHRFGGGDPVFHTGVVSSSPFSVVHLAATIVIWPISAAAAVGLVIALRRGGSSRNLALALAAGIVIWLIADAGMTLAGFPAVQRFLLPAAAAGCVLAGVAFGSGWRSVHAASQGRVGGRVGGLQIPIAIAVVALGAISVWYGSSRFTDATQSIRREQTRAADVRNLEHAIAQAGGPARLKACGYPTADLAFQPMLAWDLGVAVAAIGTQPAIDLRRRPHVLLFAIARSAARGRHRRLLSQVGRMRVVAVRPSARCLNFRPQA